MSKITIYGSGTIGNGWGAVFLKGGYEVALYDINEDRTNAAKESVAKLLASYVGFGTITEDEAKEMMDRATFTADPKEALEGTTFIQENGPENLEIKQAIIETIETYAPQDAIICSSSSGIIPTKIAASAKRPWNIMIGHPFNPVHLIPVVEIVKGEKTGDEQVAKAKEIYEAIGKEVCILEKEVPGFIINRLQLACVREAYDLVNNGVCSVESVDKAMAYSIGLRWAIMGPHMVYELGGGPLGWGNLMRNIFPSTNVIFEDMAKWTVLPEGYIDKGLAGIAEEMAHRAPGTGQTHEELQEHLNKNLVEILKLHGKL